MIYKRLGVLAVIAVLFGTIAFASQIHLLELEQLPERTEATVLANVIQVDKNETLDNVTIKIVSVVKGNIDKSELRLVLSSRGVKGFDPELKVGDNGVFFLKDVKGSDAKLAYWGSVAIFQKNHFSVTKNQKSEK